MRVFVEEPETCLICGVALAKTQNSAVDRMICLSCAGLNDAADQVEEDWSAPHPFGSYFIDRHKDGRAHELERGAIGVTYRAIDTSLQRAVALKVIKTGLVGRNAETLERFTREARAASALRHPNVATVYHFGISEDTGECFYAMEFVDGETLDARVRRIGPFDVRTTIDIANQIASALAAAEKRGLAYHDLKPANVMIATPRNSDGVGELSDIQIKIIDFGVTKALAKQADPRGWSHNGSLDTSGFASPEQLTNRDMSVDIRSDIYSLGATLWYALTGNIPFAGRTPNQPCEARRTPPVGQLRAARVPDHMVSLLCEMLAIEPAARPSLGDLFARLEEIRARISRREKRRRLLRIAAVLTAAGVIAATMFSLIDAPASWGDEAQAKTVTVLPFKSLTNDSSGTSVAGGVRDDLMADLSKAVVRLKPQGSGFHSTLAEIYARLGRKEDAILESERAVETTPEWKDAWYGPEALMELAHTYVMVGEHDLALSIIEHLHKTPAGLSNTDLRLDPIWDPLRSDPRFQKLLDQSDVIVAVPATK